MNILIEGGDLNPPFAEGTRNIVFSYAIQLQKHGHNVCIITRRKDIITHKFHPKKEQIYGINFYRYSNILELPFLLYKICKKENIDIVHTFVKGFRSRFFALYIKNFLKKKYVLSLLGWPDHKKSIEKVRESVYNLQKTVDKLLITSKTIFNLLKPSEELEYLPFGVDTLKFKPIFCKDKYFKVLWLRQPTLMLSMIIKNISDLKIILLSRKNESFFQKFKFLKPHKCKQIKFIKGFVKMQNLYNKVDLVMDLHNPKGFLGCASPPLSILEAMACTTPVISTKHPQIQEVILDKKTGFLIENNNLNEILHLLENRESIDLEKIGKNARKFIERNFSWNRLIKKYEKMYDKLM